MSKLPVLRARELVQALLRAGFFIHHQKGSHVRLRSILSPIRHVTIPYHGGDIPQNTLRRILEQAGLTVDELKEVL